MPAPVDSFFEVIDRLQEEAEFVFLDTARPTRNEDQSLLFSRPLDILELTDLQDLDKFFALVDDLSQRYYLAGWFAYELGYLWEERLISHTPPIESFARLGVYQRPQTLSAFGERPPCQTQDIARCKPQLGKYLIDSVHPTISKDEYMRRVNRIRQWIAAGDTYQVNLTHKLRFKFSGDPLAFYSDLRFRQPTHTNALIRNNNHWILSCSPELFFRQHGVDITLKPMKGTATRGRFSAEDARQSSFLMNDPKNRGENTMIVDLIRNDLGKICCTGSIQVPHLFETELLPTVIQMTSTVTGKRSDTKWSSLFRSLFPSGSVTGAPKIRTMQIIRELEGEPRGVYTGAIGYLGPSGHGIFNIPIRTVVLHGDQGELGIGSGIVYDSCPEEEYKEVNAKARFFVDSHPEFELIETLLWKDGFIHQKEHLDRLKESAQYFGFFMEEESVYEFMENYANDFSPGQRYRVRILLNRFGRITGSSEKINSPTEICHKPVKIRWATSATNSNHRFLYHKTTCREQYDLEREQALKEGCFDVVFCNERGEITEGSISNIFIRKNSRLYTPPLDCGLLPGTIRQEILRRSSRVEERVMYKEDLQNADGIYLTNSIRGFVPAVLSE